MLSTLLKKTNICYTRERKGYITLLMVLVVGGIILTAVVGMIKIGIGSRRSTASLEHAKQAGATADACVEQALLQIKSAGLAAGTGELTLAVGNCEYAITATGDGTGEVFASGTVARSVRRVRVRIATTTPQLLLYSWQEAGD